MQSKKEEDAPQRRRRNLSRVCQSVLGYVFGPCAEPFSYLSSSPLLLPSLFHSTSLWLFLFLFSPKSRQRGFQMHVQCKSELLLNILLYSILLEHSLQGFFFTQAYSDSASLAAPTSKRCILCFASRKDTFS